MTTWITREAACEAVRMVTGSHLGFELRLIAPEDAILAILTIPAPPEPSEDELVEEMADTLWRSHNDGYPTVAPAESNLWRRLAVAVLACVRQHDRREAAEVREVLREVLDAPARADRWRLSTILECGLLSDALRARAERAVKGGK